MKKPKDLPNAPFMWAFGRSVVGILMNQGRTETMNGSAILLVLCCTNYRLVQPPINGGTALSTINDRLRKRLGRTVTHKWGIIHHVTSKWSHEWIIIHHVTSKWSHEWIIWRSLTAEPKKRLEGLVMNEGRTLFLIRQKMSRDSINWIAAHRRWKNF